MAKISMEQFADETGKVVSIDQFKRRQVEAVGMFDNPEEDQPVWTIRFADGAQIHNYDPTIPAPTHIVGAELNLIILGGHNGATGQSQTELRFGLNPVYLNPLEYAMQDPAITDNKIVFAQRSRANL